MLDQYAIPDEETFIDFLQKGKLGPLHLSLSEGQVYDLFDRPDETNYPALSASVHENQNQPKEAPMMVLKYGNLRILFEYGAISSITIDYRYEDYGLPVNLDISWFDAIKKMKLNSFRQFLKNRGISYKRAALPDFWNNTILVLDNAEVLFATRDTDSIDAISFSKEEGNGRPVVDDNV